MSSCGINYLFSKKMLRSAVAAPPQYGLPALMLEWVWTPQFPKTHPQTFAFPEVSLYKEVTGKHAQFCWEQTTQWASGPQLALLTHTLAWELIVEFLLMALKSCTPLPKCEGEVPSLEGDTAPGSSSSHVERPADGANSQPRNLLGYLWI